MDLSLLADAATAAPSSEASEAAFVLSELRTASAMEDESGMPSPGDTEVTENFMDLHPWTHEEDALLPRPVAALSGLAVRMVACGSYQTAVVTERGELFSWGWQLERAPSGLPVANSTARMSSSRRRFMPWKVPHPWYAFW